MDLVDAVLHAVQTLRLTPVSADTSAGEASPSGYWGLEFCVDAELRALHLLPILEASDFRAAADSDGWIGKEDLVEVAPLPPSDDRAALNRSLVEPLRAAARKLTLPTSSSPGAPLAARTRGLPIVLLEAPDDSARWLCDVVLGDGAACHACFKAIGGPGGDTRTTALLVRDEGLQLVHLEEGASNFGMPSYGMPWSALAAFSVEGGFLRVVRDGELLAWRFRSRETSPDDAERANQLAAAHGVSADWRASIQKA